MPTIRDVAEAAGVSPTTVSFVLNNGPRPVSAATRARVLEAMQRLRFEPNAAARGLARRRMNNIGVQFADLEAATLANTFSAELLSGILSVAADADYDVLLLTHRWRGAHESAAALNNGRMDGILVVTPPIGSDVVAGLAGQRMPLVTVGAPLYEGVCMIDGDNVQGARLATEHLIALGHRRIAHIAGSLEINSAVLRRDSYLATLRAAGLPTPPEYVENAVYFVQDTHLAKEAAWRLLSLPEPPTALFAANDAIAIAAIEIARQRGLRVPEDLSVVGFDDSLPATYFTPPLTTIRQPHRNIGITAARLLLERIEGKTPRTGPHLLPVELVLRGTTAPPPAYPTSREASDSAITVPTVAQATRLKPARLT